MINFDDYYFLLHAYDVLGRHLYGDGWDGTEYKQDSVPSPSEVDEKRKPHIESIQLIEPRLNEIAKAISKEVRAGAIHKLKTEEADLLARRGQHESTLHEYWQPGASHQHRYDRYKRGQTAEEHLLAGMKNNAFPAHYNGSQVIEWDYWERQPGCRFVFSLSLLKAGDRVSGKRWGYVTIERKKFHEWLKTIEPIRGIGIEEYSAEEKFATFLRKEVAAGPKKKTVHWYLDYALNEFGLGPRPARRIWEQTTPAAWRKGGRPKKP